MTDRYHGILNINKPTDWTSHDVVARVRRIAGQRSVGHAGTLDPAATGVLLVCLGQATRVAEYLMAGDKTYRALIRLGTTTDTYDADGEVTATGAVPDLSAPDLESALTEFTGEIQQFPPAYSAIKQDGVPLHRRARRGEEIQLQARPVTIYRIDVLEWRSPDLNIDVACAPGTYIRSLAHDLGQRLGCGAHLAGLVRTRSGHFSLDEAITLQALADAAAQGALEARMPSMQAPDRPRRPIRRMQRTRESCRARPRTTSQVPSGELSSTKMTSQAFPASAASSRRNSVVTLSRSLKVGTTTESCGVATACGGLSGPGLMASFMRQHISDRLRGSQGGVKVQIKPGMPKIGQNGPRNANDHEQGRAYIRRCLTIQWSSQRRSYEASTSPLEARWG